MSNRMGMALILMAVVLAATAVWLLMPDEPAAPMDLSAPLEETSGARAPSSFVSPESSVPDPKDSVEYADEESTRELLEPTNKPITGVVLEQGTGLPVEGVYVLAQRRNSSGSFDYDDAMDTKADGSFRLKGLKDTTYQITACHVDYDEVSLSARPGDEDLVIHLPKNLEYAVRGMVYDDAGLVCSGIEITLTVIETGVKLVTESDQSGKYAFPSLPPGWVKMVAKRPKALKSRGIDFTDERKKVEIVDRDLIVDFGDASDHVTWRGTLYNFEGKPVSEASIRITMVSPMDPGQQGDVLCSVHPDADGRFEARKLVPGRFMVKIELWGRWFACEDGTWAYDPGNDAYHMYLTFDSPGVHDRDIRIEGALVSGTVIDERTGEPAAREGEDTIWMKAYLPDGRFFSTDIFQDGRFQFKGLPPGTYSFSVQAIGRGRGSLKFVEVGEKQVLDHLRIVLPLSGSMDLSMQGFNNAERSKFTAQLVGRQTFNIENLFISQLGMHRGQFDLGIGSWRLILKGEKIGRIERTFIIYDGKKTEVIIDGRDSLSK